MRRVMMCSGGGGGGGSPPLMANLLVWLPAGSGQFTDSGVTHVSADGDLIQEWADASGNGFHAIQTDASFKPIYRTTETYAGKDLVEYPTSRQAWFDFGSGLNAALIAAGGACMYVALRNLDANTVQHGAWWFSNGSPGSATYTWSDGNIYETFGRTNQLNVGAPGVDLSAAFHIYKVTAVTNHYQVMLDTTALYNSTAAFTPSFPTWTGASNGTTLGFGRGTPLGGLLSSILTLHARVSAVLIYNTEVTGTDDTAARTFLGA